MPKKKKSLNSLQKKLNNLSPKPPKKPKNNFTPFFILFGLSILLATLIPYVNTGVQTVNEDVSLSQLEKNYNDGLYSEILIDGNKAIATLSGSTVTQ